MRRALRDAGAVLGIALLSGALLAFTLLYQREAALRSGEQLAESLSRVISEQTARTLQAADQTLRLAVVRLQALREAGLLDPERARELLREELQGVAFLRAMWVVDAHGYLVLGSDAANAGSYVGDRPYFQVYQREPQTNFFIGPALRSRTTGAWMVTVARPIRGPDGQVRQVIAAALEPPYFEQLWRGIDLGASGAVVLYHRSGQLLARSPMDERLRGRDFSQLPIFREYLPQSLQGTYIRESGIDGVRRVIAYRQLANYPELLVAVGSGYDEMLQPWRRFAGLTSAVFAVAVLVALALTLQLRRQARRREQTEERFRRLAQAVPQIVFVADRKGAVQYITQRWRELTGCSTEEALGNRWQQQVHPEDREGMVQTLARMVASGEEVHVQHRLRHADGSYRWQLLRALPVREGGGTEAVSWFGTCTDIDELKQAQQRLLQQAEQLRIAGRLTRMGSWRIDLDGQRLSLSEEAAAVLDLPPDAQPVLQDLVAMVAPASAPGAMDAWRRCAEEGEPFDLELEIVTPTGRHVWIRTIGEAIRDEAGRVVAVQGAQQDITLRMLMMEEIRCLNASLEERITQRTSELARQEALFRTLAEQAPLPIWTLDPHGKATFLSAAFYELFGGAPPDWLGEAWIRLLHPDDLVEVQQNWIRSMTSGAAFIGTRRMRGTDGGWHTMRYRAVPVRGPQGEILFWVGVEMDITDLIAKEAALRLANTQLESFSYSVSHDLQSPLQRVAQFARLLQDELAQLGPGGKAQHYLERILVNAATMSQLIEGLLALAHVSEVELIRSTVNLSDAAADILLRLQAEQPQRQVHWRVEPGLTVAGDARLMRSVLENLIGNAWKFTGGTAAAEITVGGSRERGEYFVRDNGCGFDMAYADRLFGTFQRLHGYDEFPGTGIGLATVARAISRQGGRVWAHSAPGEGATFYFTLPPA